MTTKTTSRSLVSLKLPRAAPALIASAKTIVQGMTNNPAFPTPDPPLPTVSAAISALESAQTAANVRTHGAVALRNEKRTALVALLEQVKSYVQKTSDASPETATSIIESAGVSVRKPVVRHARVFAATQGAVSGSVHLTLPRAAPRASYDWEYSTDGKTWLSLPSTLKASTTVSGLTPGATVSFRYRALTAAGEGDWSQPTSIMVK